jgi:hypothetical protein
MNTAAFSKAYRAWRLAFVAAGMGIFVFSAGIGIDWLLTSSRRAVLYSDAVTALVASVLTFCVIRHYYLRQQMAEAHVRALNDVNHHVRNALTAISYCAYLSQDSNVAAVTQNSIARIDRALRDLSREILPEQAGIQPDISPKKRMHVVPADMRSCGAGAADHRTTA